MKKVSFQKKGKLSTHLIFLHFFIIFFFYGIFFNKHQQVFGLKKIII